MIPKEFEYAAPDTLDEALALLTARPDEAKVLAGGHSLIPLMKLRLAEPALLVDLGRIGPLRGISNGGNELTIRAMTTHQQLTEAAELTGAAGLIADCARQIGDPQVRNRGTFGGSLAHADPAADLPAAVLALDAELEAAAQGGATRRIKAADFFTDLLTTALQPGEILTQVHVPQQQGHVGTAYVKLRNKASHYALVGVAAVVTLGDDGRVSRAALAVTGAAATPFRVPAAEDALRNGQPGNGAIDHAADLLAAHDVEWNADLHGSAEYRKHMASVLAKRAIRLAMQRAHA
jgi:carbon-monoxide dehydrogenase medium subunit